MLLDSYFHHPLPLAMLLGMLGVETQQHLEDGRFIIPALDQWACFLKNFTYTSTPETILRTIFLMLLMSSHSSLCAMGPLQLM